MIKINV